MKFFTAAVAAVAALASFSEAKINTKDKKAWKEALNHRMKNNMYNKEVLMKKAQPHNDAAKNREAQRQLGDFEITGAYNIQFLSCFSLTTSYDELFENANDNNGGMGLNMWRNGNAMAEQSYAIFRMCYNSHCQYTEGVNDPTLEYVIDLDTYVQALVEYLPEQVEEFCEGCQENQDSCYAMLYGGFGYAGQYGYGGEAYQQGNSYGQQQQGDNYNANSYQYDNANAYRQQGYNPYGNNANGGNNADANGGGRRKLSDIHNQESRRMENGQVVRQIDCNLCVQYGCIESYDGNNYDYGDQYSFESAAEWLTELAQCYETGIAYGGNGYYQQDGDDGNLYAGFICNDEGNGVEIGMFLDEACSLYLINEPYMNYMSYFDQTYHDMTEDIMEFTFSSAMFSCSQQEVVYTTQNVDGYQQQYYQDANQYYNNGEQEEAADWCAYLYDNEMGTYPVNMYDCDGSAYNNYYQRYGMDDDDNMYKYQYNWYNYEIYEEDAIDMQAVCLAVKKANGELHTFYNPNNGHLYNYGSTGTSSGNVEEFLDGSDNESVTNYKKKSKRDLSGGAIFGIVAAVGVVVGALVAVVIKLRSSAGDKKEPLMAGELDAGGEMS